MNDKKNMTTIDWRKHVSVFHALDHADEPESLILGNPADAVAVAEWEKFVGRAMPEEFRSFYTTHDGFGAEFDDEVEWFFLPLAMMPEFATEIRGTFEGTHPDLAKRFVPFADWGTGDACGYLYGESGEREEGIYLFEHESYDYDAEQDWNEFLYVTDETIVTFLTE